jgi:predicted DNA-binding transcriptional regulator AlpA
MSTDASGSRTSAPASVLLGTVSTSKWVNETYPAWDQTLAAHDVTRLTRRHRWVLVALTLLGRFPKPQRFHGRRVGWGLREVEQWIARVRDERICTTSPGETTSSTAAVVDRGRECPQGECGRLRAQAGAQAWCRTRWGAEQRRKPRRVARARRATTTRPLSTDGR